MSVSILTTEEIISKMNNNQFPQNYCSKIKLGQVYSRILAELYNMTEKLNDYSIEKINTKLNAINNSLYKYFICIFDSNETGINKPSRSLQNIYDDNNNIKLDHNILSADTNIILFLDKLPKFNEYNNTPELYRNEEFLNNIKCFIYILLKYQGLYTRNIGEYLPIIKKIIDNKFYEDIIIIKCNRTDNTSYTCGRAFSNIPGYENYHTKFLIFNTVSTNDDDMDIDFFMDESKRVYNSQSQSQSQLQQQQQVQPQSQSQLQQQKQQSYHIDKLFEDKYYKLYIKYKNKYLKLKAMNN